MKKIISIGLVIVAASIILSMASASLLGLGVDCNCYDGYCLNIEYAKCDMFCMKETPGWTFEPQDNFCYYVSVLDTDCIVGEYCQLKRGVYNCSGTKYKSFTTSCSEECPGCSNSPY